MRTNSHPGRKMQRLFSFTKCEEYNDKRVFTRSATVRNTEHIKCVVQNNVRTLQWEK